MQKQLQSQWQQLLKVLKVLLKLVLQNRLRIRPPPPPGRAGPARSAWMTTRRWLSSPATTRPARPACRRTLSSSSPAAPSPSDGWLLLLPAEPASPHPLTATPDAFRNTSPCCDEALDRELIASVLERHPPPDASAEAVLEKLDVFLLQRCLQRDPQVCALCEGRGGGYHSGTVVLCVEKCLSGT